MAAFNTILLLKTNKTFLFIFFQNWFNHKAFKKTMEIRLKLSKTVRLTAQITIPATADNWICYDTRSQTWGTQWGSNLRLTVSTKCNKRNFISRNFPDSQERNVMWLQVLPLMTSPGLVGLVGLMGYLDSPHPQNQCKDRVLQINVH